jgi:hypothetical protein
MRMATRVIKTSSTSATGVIEKSPYAITLREAPE